MVYNNKFVVLVYDLYFRVFFSEFEGNEFNLSFDNIEGDFIIQMY